MRVISIKQPWASLIIEGGKDIENRGWYPKPLQFWACRGQLGYWTTEQTFL